MVIYRNDSKSVVIINNLNLFLQFFYTCKDHNTTYSMYAVFMLLCKSLTDYYDTYIIHAAQPSFVMCRGYLLANTTNLSNYLI